MFRALSAVTRRRLPLALWLRLLVARPLFHVGWAFAALGVLAVAAFLPRAELPFVEYELRMTGAVVAVSETNASENDRDVYAVHYVYDLDGRQHEGVSYTVDPPEPDTVVPVEVDLANPARSRLEGARSRPFGALVLAVLAFPIAGLAIVVAGLWQGRRDAVLLAVAQAGPGRVVGCHVRQDSDGDQVHHATVEYQRDGRAADMQLRRGQRQDLAIGDAVTVFYDPRSARDTRLGRDLPGRPRLDAAGALAFDGGWPWLHLATPAGAALVAVASWLLIA